MRRLSLLAALAALAPALAGCPIPQPLPDYPKGQPVTPPRIVVDDTVRRVAYPETVVRVPAGCAVEPVYPLDANLRDVTSEPFAVRWFVNYDPKSQPTFVPQQRDDVQSVSGSDLRQLPRPFPFPPYQYAPAAGSATAGAEPGALHVVELVVSNGFDGNADSASAALPYRTPLLGFEVQVYRWVFLTVPASADVPCPTSQQTP